MIQIEILSPAGIKIAGAVHPNNSITFQIVNVDHVEIRNLNKKLLHSAPYTDYMNSTNVVYASAQAVIDALTLSYSA